MEEDHHDMSHQKEPFPQPQPPLKSPWPGLSNSPIFTAVDQTPDQHHGLANGYDALEKETYEVWVSSDEMARYLTRKEQEKKAQLRHIDEKITQEKAYVSSQQSALWQYQHQLNSVKLQRGYLDEQKKDWHQRLTLGVQRMQSLQTSASFFIGLLYFVAAWVFILGDLIISHEIVAYALHIRGTFESWAFAVGLALISVLLKPAYDQWIEQPFLRDGNTARYRQFHGIVAVLAILAVGILGGFRYEAYQVEQQKLEINRQIRQLQTTSDPSDLALVEAPLQQKMAQFSALSLSLVNSPRAVASFVLSGILFALAGAICLGLSLPILHAYWFRWFHFNRLKRRSRKKIHEIDQQDLAFALEQSAHQTALDACQSVIYDLQLDIDRTQLIHEIDSIQEKLIRARENIRISQYSEGYQRGVLVRQQATVEELRAWRSSWGFPSSKPKTSSLDNFLPEFLP